MWEFVLILSLTVVAHARAENLYYWNVSWMTAYPDGFARPVIGVNGRWPIPSLVVQKYEKYTLRVINFLNDTSVYNNPQNITIHTHGIDEWNATVYDGVDLCTQWYCDVG